jgi:hypothetical protein
MGVLDDAIREHLELKRRHGASDEELTRAEQEALGPARRDPVDPADAAAAPVPDETGHQPHGDPIAHEQQVAHEAPQDATAPPPAVDAPTQFLPPESGVEEATEALQEPAVRPVEEAALAEERVVEGEAHAEAPGDMTPQAPVVDAGPQSPIEPAPGAPYDEPTAPHQPARVEEHVQEDEQALHPEEPQRQGDPLVEDEHRVEEHALEDAEHHFEEDAGEHHEEAAPPVPAEEERNERDDLLEDTPDFLQETPEHDRLWFEQRPPRDFDFDE